MGSRCYTITTPCMWPSPGSAKHWPKKTQDSLFSPSTKPHRASFPSSLCLIQMASGQGPIASLLPLSTFYLICSKTGRLGCLGGPGTCVLFGGHSSGARGPWTVSARGAPAVHSQRLTTRTSACLQGTSQLVNHLAVCLCLHASPWRPEGLTILVPLPATEKREA